jgi:glyoxylase-like metal-dependent hydrolase (beta-lactamase superfamily II)
VPILTLVSETSTDESIYFRQLLSGRDFAVTDQVAIGMVNFAYVVGDRSTGECVLIDPAYAVNEIMDIVEADDMKVTGVLATHYHPDHIGGKMMGFNIEGITTLLERAHVPIHVQKTEVDSVVKVTGVSPDDLSAHDPGDVIQVGSIEIALIHTPGHTPGSQCFLVRGALISGDTLFLDSCGRTDLPDSNVEDMYHSLNTLAQLPDNIVVLPGHQYSQAPAAYLGEVKEQNIVYKPKTKEAWLTMFGRD